MAAAPTHCCHTHAYLTRRFAFGSTGQGRNAMSFVEGDKLLFPTGVHVAVYSRQAEEVRGPGPLGLGRTRAREVARTKVNARP